MFLFLPNYLLLFPQSRNRNTCTFALEFCQGENMQKNNDKNPSSGACRKKYEVFLYNKCKIFIVTSRGAVADEYKRKTLRIFYFL